MSAIHTKEIEGVFVVGFESEELLQEHEIQEAGEELMQVADRADGRQLVLSFAGVKVMSSAMLGKLVMFLKHCQELNVQLKVCGIAPGIFEVFKITKYDQLFDVQADERAALASFSK